MRLKGADMVMECLLEQGVDYLKKYASMVTSANTGAVLKVK